MCVDDARPGRARGKSETLPIPRPADAALASGAWRLQGNGCGNRSRCSSSPRNSYVLPDEFAEKKLKHRLDELLDGWNGLRRLPYLMSKDIGFIVKS
ncbi:hypothetical protein GCM10009546_02060 [Actinomadura livida]|uniref:Uncharacterized protein n=1 Tax=Actinomadura livida TaxID=79909 RepID=A0ABP3NGE5_9ACTN|nr:hypothetical protein GCM10010208_28300 [Actinomadura livida]